MRSMKRNQQTIHYKRLIGQEEILDEYGNSTGSFVPIYGELETVDICVSPNKGSSEVEQFGSTEEYDRTMTTSDNKIDIDENSILWVDGADPEGPYNYIVKLVAKWKNSAQFAIRKVSISEYEAEQKMIAKISEMQSR